MKPVSLTAIIIIAVLGFALYLQSGPKLTSITLKENTIFCEIADTPKERAKGLQKRERLPLNQGMLFVYTDEQIRTYHMRNVKFPIAIAFADMHGVIVDIQEMNLDQEATYPSKKPAAYALEVNKGYYKDKNINVGDKIEGLEHVLKTINNE